MTLQSPVADLLQTIVAATRRIVEVRRSLESMEALEQRADRGSREAGRFVAALSRTGTLNVIAECKRRSPSRGVLRTQYDPVAIARGYAAAGAAAISVLTEPTFFDGSLEHLVAVRAALADRGAGVPGVNDVPLLRKDFVVTEYQLVEAKAAGADAVLLIVAALDQAALRTLYGRATALGLDVLVEIHDERELDRAFDAGARIVGVNNRNLRTLEVDVDASERVAAKLPADAIAVCESGLKTADDLRRFQQL
ncbi:MAG TPA: indole-3-glycerol phosphate synthase TrpC, partial [Vicinamibacterales bacterium]|nr:indole-3-glycerol phosphate synthase TrpC [Vicinamibacterales bacterium]